MLKRKSTVAVCSVLAALGLLAPLTTAVANPDDDQTPATVTHTIERDTDTIIINPMMGWLMYAEEFGRPFPNPDSPEEQDHFWEIVEKNNRLRDASGIYIRVPWSRLEPEEGRYAWQEGVDPLFMSFINKAKQYNKKLSFRVFIDSQDTHMQATPEWVFQKTGKGRNVHYPPASNRNFKNPDVDNIYFKEAFEKFLMAFGEEFDDPSVVEFIDLNTIGAWGEMHGVKWMNREKWDRTIKWLDDSYMAAFKNVMLVMNYAPSSFGWEAYDRSIDKGMAMRRDGVGSTRWFSPGNKTKIKQNFPKTIFVAENCYQAFELWPRSCDDDFKPTNKMLNRVVDEALDLHANYLDLRKAIDVRTFVDKYPELVKKFGVEGGYRIAPNSITLPEKFTQFEPAPFTITWENTGVGRLPNGLLNLEDRWRIQYSLVDGDGRIVQRLDSNIDPGKLYKTHDEVAGSGPVTEQVTVPANLPAGTYGLQAAIVDRTLNGEPGVKLAVKDTNFEAPSWVKLADVTIEPDPSTIRTVEKSITVRPDPETVVETVVDTIVETLVETTTPEPVTSYITTTKEGTPTVVTTVVTTATEPTPGDTDEKVTIVREVTNRFSVGPILMLIGALLAGGAAMLPWWMTTFGAR